MNRVVIIGGGTAGVTAACSLATQGITVLVFERAPRLGGRAGSFYHRGMNEWVDYGQHVLMRSCTRTIEFLSQVGAADGVCFQKRLRIPLICGSRKSVITSMPLLGPLHLLPNLVRYRHLPLPQRLSLIQGVLPLLLRRIPENVTFGDWLTKHGQLLRAVTTVWDPICVATLNEHARVVSASAAGTVFKKGFLASHGADLGLFTVSLFHIFERARSFLRDHGGKVQVNSRVTRILVKRGRVTGIELDSGKRIETGSVIAAIPPHNLRPLLPGVVATDEYFTAMRTIPFSPIVNLHLWFDRPVMEERFVIAIDSPLQAVFNLTEIHREGPQANHLVISQSAANEWIGKTTDEIKQQLIMALSEQLPAVTRARVLAALVIKHRKATIRLAPGIEALRPQSITPIDGLLLAGDHTATGWPSTLEGAVRSGLTAARNVM